MPRLILDEGRSSCSKSTRVRSGAAVCLYCVHFVRAMIDVSKNYDIHIIFTVNQSIPSRYTRGSCLHHVMVYGNRTWVKKLVLLLLVFNSYDYQPHFVF
ncbi:unnamed protein product [Cylicocyclus nassatus]|uniref:Uncharacterized protein n=1 Tax=Cylicocyclus nassatus TaxID=53992 RepID=A0AA36DLH8_CYLNA|nr:unnamed protein product [Cylicocyclus nassatus]